MSVKEPARRYLSKVFFHQIGDPEQTSDSRKRMQRWMNRQAEKGYRLEAQTTAYGPNSPSELTVLVTMFCESPES